jgi:hypothetical protein
MQLYLLPMQYAVDYNSTSTHLIEIFTETTKNHGNGMQLNKYMELFLIFFAITAI